MEEVLNTNKEEDRLKQLERFWVPAEHAMDVWAPRAKEDLNFYLGGERQWDSSDLTILRDQKRPALTYNHLLALINLVSGYQRQNRKDIKVYNRKGGDRHVAEILTKIIKHVVDNEFGEWEKSMAFLIGIITGRGWIGVNKDYEDDILNGDIILQSHSPFNVYPDPFSARYDMRDAMFLFTTSWLPQSRIKLLYPDKEKELSSLTVKETERQAIPVGSGDSYHDADAASTSMSDIEKYRFRVKQCWWKKFETQHFIVGTESGMVRRVELPVGKIKALIEMSAKKNDGTPTLHHIRRVNPVMNLTTYVGTTELEHVEDPNNGITRFPIVPFRSYFVNNEDFGVITQLKDPQREINKRLSQALHHLNQSANSGWIADDDALAPDKWDDLETYGSKPGIVIKKKPGSSLERVNPSALSDAHLTLAQAGKQNIRDVSGVNPDLAGVPSSKQESGVLAELRRNQGLVALESVFDNFDLTNQIVGALLVDMIQKTDVYSRQEMITLVVDGEIEDVDLKKQLQERGIEQIKNDLTIGKYKVVISQNPRSPTIRLRNFQVALEAVKAGVPLPPEVLIDLSDFPDKEKILEKMKELQAQPPVK